MDYPSSRWRGKSSSGSKFWRENRLTIQVFWSSCPALTSSTEICNKLLGTPPPTKKCTTKTRQGEYIFFNPLTPMPALTGHDEPWPFFHFWHHHFWPKLASSMLNSCRKRRSIQWWPDQIDRPTGAWDMHKNAPKVEQKTQTKISCHYFI